MLQRIAPHLPSTKVAVGTMAAGVLSAWLSAVDWQALVIAVVTLVVSYLAPELNPSPSTVRRVAEARSG